MSTHPQLPLEIHYNILSITVTNSLHAIGTGIGSSWDIKSFSTLAEVSRIYQAIILQFVGKLFYIKVSDSEDNLTNVFKVIENWMLELQKLDGRDTWATVVQTYPTQYPSYIFHAYALWKCSTEMRKTSLNVPGPAYLAIQDATLTTLEQAERAASLVTMSDCTAILRYYVKQEKMIMKNGIAVVRSCMHLNSLMDRLNGTSGDSPDEHTKIKPIEDDVKKALQTAQGVIVNYQALVQLMDREEPTVNKLPEVACTFKRISSYYTGWTCSDSLRSTFESFSSLLSIEKDQEVSKGSG